MNRIRTLTFAFTLLTAFALPVLPAPASLLPGDLQILGFRSDAEDSLSFVIWRDIFIGDTLFFTDSGFFSDGTMRDSESVLQWTADSPLAAGTVVVIDSLSTSVNALADTGTATRSLNGLSTDGDQVFAGTGAAFPTQGHVAAPGSAYAGTLLYGLDFNGSSGWDASAINSSTSFLPGELQANPLLQFATPHFDNGQYSGTRTGLTATAFQAMIDDPLNWTFHNDGASFGSLNSADFVITSAVPEPSHAVLALLLGGSTLFFSRRRRRTG